MALFGGTNQQSGYATGKPQGLQVVGYTFAQKLEHFSALTGGESGIFYILVRMGNPKVRNGLAHGTAWFDQAARKVRYTDGRQSKTEYEMGLLEFATLAKLGCDLARS